MGWGDKALVDIQVEDVVSGATLACVALLLAAFVQRCRRNKWRIVRGVRDGYSQRVADPVRLPVLLVVSSLVALIAGFTRFFLYVKHHDGDVSARHAVFFCSIVIWVLQCPVAFGYTPRGYIGGASGLPLLLHWLRLLIRFRALSIDLIVADSFLVVAQTAAQVSLAGYRWVSFSWVYAAVIQQFSPAFGAQSLLSLDDDTSVLLSEHRFADKWRSGHATIHAALWSMWRVPYLTLAVIKGFTEVAAFGSPLLMERLLATISDHPTDHRLMGVYLAAMVLLSLGLAVVRTHYDYKMRKIGASCRAALTMAVLRHAAALRHCDRDPAWSSGYILNLVSSDASKIADQIPSLNDIWTLPLQVACALYLLYRQVSFAFISGLVFSILMIPLNRMLAKRIQKVNVKMTTANDDRIQQVHSILHNIKYIILCGWCRKVQPWVLNPRREYFGFLRWLKLLDAWCVFFWATTPTFVSLATFATYVWMGHTLTPSRAFTALALFNTLITPLNAFPWVVNGVVEARVSLRRISRFMASYDAAGAMHNARTRGSRQRSSQDEDDRDAAQHPSIQADMSDRKVVATLDNCLVRVSERYRLSISELPLQRGELVTVAGKAGSGKSALLSAITGQFSIENGVHTRPRSIALVPQTPFLFQGTVRENIILGKEFDAGRYKQVVKLAVLERDLELVGKGDATLVGDGGSALSGGQRTRVALARAMYQDCELYLLDDPLGCVDPQVAAALMDGYVKALVMNGKAVVLVTHFEKFLRRGARQYEMVDGVLLPHEAGGGKGSVKEQADVADEQSKEEEQNPDWMDAGDGAQENEVAAEGHIDKRVSKQYIAAVGYPLAAAVVLLMAVMQAVRNLGDWWISYWLKSGSTDMHYFLKILALLAGLNCIAALLRSFSFAFAGLRAAQSIHDRLFGDVMELPMSFFTAVPAGRVVNRLSRDVQVVDDNLPFTLNIVLAQLFLLIGSTVVILCSASWVTLVAFLPIFYLYYRLQRPYRVQNRELKRLESASRSPLFDAVSHVLEAFPVLQAFGDDAVDFFVDRARSAMTTNQQCNYAIISLMSWFSLRLQLIGCAMLTAVGVVAVVANHSSSGGAADVGLALAYVTPLTSYLSGLLGAFTELEKYSVSVERIVEFNDHVSTYSSSSTPKNVPSQGGVWPVCGDIAFRDVSLQYSSGTQALSSVTFTVDAGERVAIVGRTGAGKSSILNALLSTTPLGSGSVTIDGVDVAGIDGAYLRSRLAVMPQEPFIVEGSVRFNVDPFGEASDEEVCYVLQRLGSSASKMSLDFKLRADGKNISAGERQIISLARMLLVRSSVVLLDEATSAIDHEAEDKVQQLLRTEFRGCTVLTIAHRLHTVMDYDRVLVMAGGRIVEAGAPSQLKRLGGDFASLVQAASRAKETIGTDAELLGTTPADL